MTFSSFPKIRFFYGRFWYADANTYHDFYLGERPSKLMVFWTYGGEAPDMYSLYWNGGTTYTQSRQIASETTTYAPDTAHRIGYDAYNYTAPSPYVTTGNLVGGSGSSLKSINNDGFSLFHGWSTVCHVVALWN